MAFQAPGSMATCIPNINKRERRKRLSSGIAALAVALAVLLLLMIGGAPVWQRLILFPLYWVGTSGIFQWREKT